MIFCGEDVEIAQLTLGPTGAGRPRPKFLSGDPAEAARWLVAERRGWGRVFFAYARWALSRQSSVAVRLGGSIGGLLTCPAPPSFAVSSRKRDSLHAVWLLAEGVDRALGHSLEQRSARRLHGYPETLIPVPGHLRLRADPRQRRRLRLRRAQGQLQADADRQTLARSGGLGRGVSGAGAVE